MPKIDLEKLSFQELQQLANAVESKISEKKTEEQQRVYEEMRALAASIGMTVDEIVEGQTRSRRGRRMGPHAPAKPKYRNPDNPMQTWSGRGKKPGWVQAWLDAGKDLGELEIQ